MTDSLKFGPEWLRNMSNDNTSGSTATSSSMSASTGGATGGGGGASSTGSGGGSNNNNNSSSGSNSIVPRFQQAEYRYGREEMLSLYEKDLKLPEILPNFKKLFVEKEQLPLALSPSTDDEIVYSNFLQRPWPTRPPSLVSSRGSGIGNIIGGGSSSSGGGGGGGGGGTSGSGVSLGRATSIDRGRGRIRGAYHTSLGFPRIPSNNYDDDLRASGRIERGWPERNGGNDVNNTTDWNGSPSSSPRKEYNSHGRSSTMENWRRSRFDDDTGGGVDGWRSQPNSGASVGSGGTSSSSYRWSRSTSWRDDDSSSSSTVANTAGSGGGGGGGSSGNTGNPFIIRSFSTSAASSNNSSTSVGNLSNGGINMSKSTDSTTYETQGGRNCISSTTNPSGPSNSSQSSAAIKSNILWDQEDIPEWAMENTTKGGGSFDATGAFHVPNDEKDEGSGGGGGGGRHHHRRRRSSSSNSNVGASNNDTNGSNTVKTENVDIVSDSQQQRNIRHQISNHGEAESGKRNLSDKLSFNALRNSSSTCDKNDMKPIEKHRTILSKSNTDNNNRSIDESERLLKSSVELSQPVILQESILSKVTTVKQLEQQQHTMLSLETKVTSSDLADRMQEVADDMVEKLIMEDELAATTSSSNLLNILKPTIAPTTISAGGIPPVQLLQHQLQVHAGHPMLVSAPTQQLPPPPPPPQSQLVPSNDIWYYRDPQNKIQGPFNGVEMAEWYRSDYFDQNLLVRRACDSRFATLGELIEMCGNSMPFLSSHLIPPLQMTKPPNSVQTTSSLMTSLSGGGQPSINTIPPPVNLNSNKPPLTGPQMLNTNDMIASLNLQLQCLQKEYLIHQQGIILSKLSTSEQFTMLSPERQQQIIQQQMTQIALPENLMNLSSFINFFYGGPSFLMQQAANLASGTVVAANNVKVDLVHTKRPNNNTNPFLSGTSVVTDVTRPDLSGLVGPLHTAMQNSIISTDSSMIPPPQQQQQQPSNQVQAQSPLPPPPPPSLLAPQTQQIGGVADDPIQALLRHLQAGKPMMHQTMGNSFPQNMMPGGNVQLMAWPTGNNIPVTSGATSTVSSHPISMWDFNSLNANMQKSEVKTEEQILEEQRLQQQQQQQQQQQIQNDKSKHVNTFAIETNSQQSMQQQQSLPVVSQSVAPLNSQQEIPKLLQQQQIRSQLQQELQQQRPVASKKSFDGNKSKSSDDSAKLTSKPVDESLKKSLKSTTRDKKDQKTKQQQQQQQIDEEQRKRDLAEERKKHKEERKRQQIEEEKKRQEELKRREILEEKRRQDEIDQHRRAKMLENSSSKSSLKSQQQQLSDSISSQQSSRLSSAAAAAAAASIAPWSNSILPGITAPATSLAEIQKAERERRAEEHRLEQEQQRRNQQIELLNKNDTLIWNAPSTNHVKSLAEIQAEEHKQQILAYEQTGSIEQHGRRIINKDDLMNNQQQSSSLFTSSSASSIHHNPSSTSTTSNSISTTSSGLSNIWSSWNGKPAWSATSNAGFWEEPVKIPTSSSQSLTSTTSKSSNNGSNTTNRTLSKSQTFSNIQTSSSSSAQQQHQQQAAATKIQSNLSKSKIATTAAAASTTTARENSNNMNKGKGNNSNPNKQTIGGKNSSAATSISNNFLSSSGGSSSSSINKKDDARNEFHSWCIKALSSMKSPVDVPTFVGFLQDIESPYEVKDYIRIYLGETKECTEFAKQFLERRSKYKNQQRAQNAHIDDMCSPAPAINPGSNDFQEVKSKCKKVKKNKMTKLDARILGFSVTAAQDRINVGDRDYGDAA